MDAKQDVPARIGALTGTTTVSCLKSKFSNMVGSRMKNFRKKGRRLLTRLLGQPWPVLQEWAAATIGGLWVTFLLTLGVLLFGGVSILATLGAGLVGVIQPDMYITVLAWFWGSGLAGLFLATACTLVAITIGGILEPPNGRTGKRQANLYPRAGYNFKLRDLVIHGTVSYGLLFAVIWIYDQAPLDILLPEVAYGLFWIMSLTGVGLWALASWPKLARWAPPVLQQWFKRFHGPSHVIMADFYQARYGDGMPDKIEELLDEDQPLIVARIIRQASPEALQQLDDLLWQRLLGTHHPHVRQATLRRLKERN